MAYTPPSSIYLGQHEIELFKEEQRRETAALRIQNWWALQSGSYVAKMKARAKMQLIKEEREMNSAALRIQAV